MGGKMEEGEEGASPSPENLSEEAEEAPAIGVSDYEHQRLKRIRENRARLEALGLPHLASSLLGSSSKPHGQAKNKGKKKKKKKKKKKDDGDEDDDYRPSDEDDCGGENDDDGESEEEEEEDVGPSSSSRRKGKSSSNVTRGEKSSFIKRTREDFDQIDDDAALQQAIALSLEEIKKDSAVVSDVVSPRSDSVEAAVSARKKKNNANTQEIAGRRKSRKMNKSRVQLTEDEVVAYFFSFDEAGKGHISLRDLQRMVLAHDFNWTEMEIASMIHSFDSDRDGKLSLEDFRSIVSRCNMLQEARNN